MKRNRGGSRAALARVQAAAEPTGDGHLATLLLQRRFAIPDGLRAWRTQICCVNRALSLSVMLRQQPPPLPLPPLPPLPKLVLVWDHPRAWGELSTTAVQEFAAAALKDGSSCRRLEKLAGLGCNGEHAGNCDRDLDIDSRTQVHTQRCAQDVRLLMQRKPICQCAHLWSGFHQDRLLLPNPLDRAIVQFDLPMINVWKHRISAKQSMVLPHLVWASLHEHDEAAFRRVFMPGGAGQVSDFWHSMQVRKAVWSVSMPGSKSSICYSGHLLCIRIHIAPEAYVLSSG